MRYFLLIATLWLSCSLCSAQTSDSLIVNQLRGKGVSFSHDNSVTLLMNGQEKFDDMFQAIRQAKHSVHLEYFNFRNDSIASLLFDLLAQKVKDVAINKKYLILSITMLSINPCNPCLKNYTMQA